MSTQSIVLVVAGLLPSAPLAAQKADPVHEFWLRIQYEEQPQSYMPAANFGAGTPNEFTQYYMGFHLDGRCRVEVVSKTKLRVVLSRVSISWSGRLPDPDEKRDGPATQWGRSIRDADLVAAADPEKTKGLELTFTVTPKRAVLHTDVTDRLRSEALRRPPPLKTDHAVIHSLLRGALERMIRQGLPQVSPEIRKLSRHWSRSRILVPCLDRGRARRGDIAVIIEPGRKKQPGVRARYVPRRGKAIDTTQRSELVLPDAKRVRFEIKDSMFYTKVGRGSQALKTRASIERFAKRPPQAARARKKEPAGSSG